MKKYIGKLTIMLFAVLLMTACSEDFLDREPLDQFSETSVWTDPGIAKAYTSGFYRTIGDTDHYWMIASISDESMFLHGYDAFFLQGGMTADNVTRWPLADGYGTREPRGWQSWYKFIKRANAGFANLTKSGADLNDEDWKSIKGELHFFRAWNYFSLVKTYGAVPIIAQRFGLDSDSTDIMIPRNTFEECISFINRDLDSAINLLGSEPVEQGRVYDAAVMALRSRVLLYAASDLYNQPGNSNPLIGYTSGSQQERWRAAQKAAKDVMDLNKFTIYKPSDDPVESYKRVFFDETNSEDILSRYYVAPDVTHYFQGVNNPNGYDGWGDNEPIQQMVDIYKWSDGSDFNWEDPVDSKDPYGIGANGQVDGDGKPLKKRDPRFYASILFDGAVFKPRPPVSVAYDPVGIIETGNYVDIEGNVLKAGLDTRQGPVAPWNGTRTGYYLRKYADEKVMTWEDPETNPWRTFRYAEILLNYAESCIELGEESKALEALEEIRDRVDMPYITSSGTQLMEDYRNERRVELAYEDQRYYDIRRWMIAEDVMSKTAMGIEIFHWPDGSTTYNQVESQTRTFPLHYYINPIPATEIRRNPKLIQNPGY